MSKTLDFVVAYLSDPAHWARGAGDGVTTACIITATWRETDSEWPEKWKPPVRQAICEWYVASGLNVPLAHVIATFNDRDCPDHATLMQVLHRAQEIANAPN